MFSREYYNILNEKSNLKGKSTLKFDIIISQQLDEEYFFLNMLSINVCVLLIFLRRFGSYSISIIDNRELIFFI